MNRGRNQLLQWINDTLQVQYTSIEMLGDCIAYCQILEVIHPGSANMTRLNFNTRYPDDCVRNSKVLEDALKKLRISQPVSMEKLGRGKFQDNIIFVQWLYNYAQKAQSQGINGFNLENLANYSGYQRRINILQKQGKGPQQMNSHLVPNQVYIQQLQRTTGRDFGVSRDHFQFKREINMPNNQKMKNQYYREQLRQQLQKQTAEQQYYQQEGYAGEAEIESKIKSMNQYIVGLQNDLRQRMEVNWRTMHLLDRSIEERNILFSLLQQVQTIARESFDRQNQDQSLLKQIINTLIQVPQEFQ